MWAHHHMPHLRHGGKTVAVFSTNMLYLKAQELSRWTDINFTFDETIFSIDKAKNLCIAELWKYFLTPYIGKRVRHESVGYICLPTYNVL